MHAHGDVPAEAASNAEDKVIAALQYARGRVLHTAALLDATALRAMAWMLTSTWMASLCTFTPSASPYVRRPT